MRQSNLATKTRKEAPVGEESRNAQLLIRAGYIHKNLAGVYSFLPLGIRSIKKIEDIIRDEMNAIGGQEITMNALQNPDVWKRSGRWEEDSDEGVWFHTNLAGGTKLGLGWTHEEVITEIMKQHIHSYKDLPKYIYQFQLKFRNEERAKSGIMRTREFVMKDMYSFCTDEEQHKEFYNQTIQAYLRVFKRVGIGDDTYRTFASGGAFSEFSDEFQTITPTGEDVIYLNKERGIALNKEVYRDEVLEKLNLKDTDLEEHKASEVGNVFTLGKRFSEALDCTFLDTNGKKQYPFMGSYGIGLGRLLGVITEKYGSDNAIVLPEVIAPYRVHLLALGNNESVKTKADAIYTLLQRANVEVLYDDRDASAGEKFADSDLIGIPHRFVISERTLNAEVIEHKNRIEEKEEMIKESEKDLLTALNLWNGS